MAIKVFMEEENKHNITLTYDIDASQYWNKFVEMIQTYTKEYDEIKEIFGENPTEKQIYEIEIKNKFVEFADFVVGHYSIKPTNNMYMYILQGLDFKNVNIE
jgi:hypothetical protein